MLTKDAVSPNLTPQTVLISMIGFVVVYGILMAVDLYLLLRNAKKGLAAGDSDSVPLDMPPLNHPQEANNGPQHSLVYSGCRALYRFLLPRGL
jgi:hypothetical protein